MARAYPSGIRSFTPKRGSIGSHIANALRGQLSKMLSLELTVRLGADPEAIHDMRVATRKLRAELRTFETFLTPSLTSFEAEFQWIATSLGKVRDLDVLKENLWAESSQLDSALLEKLLARLNLERERAHRLLVRHLASARYRRLTVEFGLELDASSLPWPSESTADPSKVGRDVLKSRCRAIDKAARNLTVTSATDDFHKVRKKAKRLRYTADAVEQYLAKSAKRFFRDLKAVQDAFGLRQDAVFGIAHLNRLARLEAFSKDERRQIGKLASGYKGRELDLREHCLNALQTFNKQSKKLFD